MLLDVHKLLSLLRTVLVLIWAEGSFLALSFLCSTVRASPSFNYFYQLLLWAEVLDSWGKWYNCYCCIQINIKSLKLSLRLMHCTHRWCY